MTDETTGTTFLWRPGVELPTGDRKMLYPTRISADEILIRDSAITDAKGRTRSRDPITSV
jgi:hypothetical protein